jgi:hypothetical protein
MVSPFEVNEPVWVIHPICHRREVNLGPVGFLVNFLCIRTQKFCKYGYQANRSPEHGIRFAEQDKLYQKAEYK